MISEVNAMLMQFRVKNYRSIGDELILDLTAGSGREHSDFLVENNGVKMLPIISLYGGNASGKTAVIEAVCEILINISESYRFGDKYGWLTTPFLYDSSLRKKPSEFEIFVALDKYEYQYGFIATPEKIEEEWLYRRTLSTRKTKSYPIFERENDKIEFAKPFAQLEGFNDLIGEKNLVLSFLGNQSMKKNVKPVKIFKDIYSWVRGSFFFNVEIVDDDRWYSLYSDSDGLKDKFLEFIHEFDPHIEDIDVTKEINRDGEVEYKVSTLHNGQPYPMEFESLGTQKLFKIFAVIFISLNVAHSVITYDELDTHLHPLIIRRIVNMFHDKEVNKMNSQLIFTSHNLIVLDNRDLRRDEIWFVEKNDKGYTSAYSLDSFKSTEKEMRADMSYGKNYLAGRFGAIPFTTALKR